MPEQEASSTSPELVGNIKLPFTIVTGHYELFGEKLTKVQEKAGEESRKISLYKKANSAKNNSVKRDNLLNGIGQQLGNDVYPLELARETLQRLPAGTPIPDYLQAQINVLRQNVASAIGCINEIFDTKITAEELRGFSSIKPSTLDIELADFPQSIRDHFKPTDLIQSSTGSGTTILTHLGSVFFNISRSIVATQ